MTNRPQLCSGCPDESKEECKRCWIDFKRDMKILDGEENMRVEINRTKVMKEVGG